MPGVTVHRPALRTIRNVELVRAGVHEISTGTWTVTPDDLRDAVAAHQAGALRRPVLKIGHQDPRFDGGFALGRIDNLRLAENDSLLIADFVDVPAAVAALLPDRYPSRSVEARTDYQDTTGRTWKLVIEAVALLGGTAPGIPDLAEIPNGVAAATGRRIVLACVRYGPTDPAVRARAVKIAAARRRRTHRITTIGVNT